MKRSRPSEYCGATRCIRQSGKNSDVTMVVAATSRRIRDQRLRGRARKCTSCRSRSDSFFFITLFSLRDWNSQNEFQSHTNDYCPEGAATATAEPAAVLVL